MKRLFLAAMLLPFMVACNATSVASNEECIQIRWGKVQNDGQKLNDGFKMYLVSEARCFDMTEQNFPAGLDGEISSESVTMEAQTRGPDVVTVRGDVSAVYQLVRGRANEIYQSKGDEEQLEQELFAAIREGYRSGIAQFSMMELFGPRRVEVGDTIKAHVERKMDRSGLIDLRAIYVRDIKAPQIIEDARVKASAQQQLLEQTRTEFQIDSIEAMKTVITAQAAAERIRLEAQSYNNAPGLLRLREITAQSEAWKSICSGVTTCIIGGNVVDKFFTGGGN